MSRIADIMNRNGGERGPPRISRRWQCFVCGVLHDSPEEYRKHIVDEHEEGRDFILCPFKHCRYPVRDVRLHAKICHPGLPVPKAGQMRATIYRDFGLDGSKKPRTRKPRFREGYYQSTKMGKQLHYRSGMEEKVYECLDADTDVLSYDVEPFCVPYLHKGHAHDYTPDIIVHYVNGKTTVLEVKPAAQTKLPKNVDKWEAARKACEHRGWGFEVLTEVGLDHLRAKVKRQFAEARFGT